MGIAIGGKEIRLAHAGKQIGVAHAGKIILNPVGVTLAWTFETPYGSAGKITLCKLTNGNIFKTSNSYGEEISPEGVQVWNNPNFLSSMAMNSLGDSDGSIYVSDSDRNLAKYDATHQQLWTIKLDNISYDFKIYGGFLYVSTYTSVSKIDLQGNVKLKIEGAAIRGVAVDASGNINVSSNTGLNKYSWDGTLISSKTDYGYKLYNITVLKDFIYVSADGHFLKLDLGGNIIWDYVSADINRVTAYYVTDNGECIVSCAYPVQNYIMKLDGNGKVVWKKLINQNTGSQLLAVSNSDIYISQSPEVYKYTEEGA